MSKSITITFPHQLSVEEAKQRIDVQVAQAKAAYIDKIGTGEMTWVGDTANIRVTALMQVTTATIEVKPAEIRVDVQLPWILAALSGKIQSVLQVNAKEALLLGTPKKAG